MAYSLIDLLMWIILAVLAIVATFAWVIYNKHDYKVRIRELTAAGHLLIFDTVGRIKIDNDKIEFLSLFKGKNGHRDLPIPPKEAIDIDPKKRKKVVEVYYSPDTGYVYITGKNNEKSEVYGFQPFTTKQRAMMINQLRKKEARKKTSWKEHIPLIVGMTALVVIITVILLFWGEFMQPFMAAIDRVESLLNRAELCSTTAGSQIIN